MVRAFRIGILKYLRDNDAVTTVIDIKTPFLSELDTMDKRKAFKKALDTLSTEKLIFVTGSYDFLNWKLINALYPIDDKVIEGRIMPKGQTYEHPPEATEKITQPEPPLDLPLPAPVKAISRFFGGTQKVNEERLKIKMKKMGATAAHLDLRTPNTSAPRYQTRHVPAVPNPFMQPIEAGSDIEALSFIPLQNKGDEGKYREINVFLKWGIIIVVIILVALVVMVLRDTA